MISPDELFDKLTRTQKGTWVIHEDTIFGHHDQVQVRIWPHGDRWNVRCLILDYIPGFGRDEDPMKALVEGVQAAWARARLIHKELEDALG